MDLFNIASIWKKKPDRLGIDFDSKSLRAVKLSKKGEDKIEVESCGTINVSLKTATPMDGQRVRAFIKQVGKGLARAAISIDDTSLRVRRMNFAKMPERDLAEAIKWNFREHIDCPIEEYQVGYTPIEGFKDQDKISYCSFGIAKKAVKEYTDMAKSIGLKVIALEPQATALLAAFDYNLNWEPKQFVVCISLGDTATYFTVMTEGQLLFSRPVAGISLEALAKLISRKMNLDDNAAFEIIAQCFSKGEAALNNGRPEVDEILKTFFHQLVVETQRSIDAFTIMFGVDHIDTIYLSGLGAYCPGILVHMRESLGVKTELFNPFSRVDDQKLDPAVREKSAIFAVAFGLAIP